MSSGTFLFFFYFGARSLTGFGLTKLLVQLARKHQLSKQLPVSPSPAVDHTLPVTTSFFLWVLRLKLRSGGGRTSLLLAGILPKLQEQTSPFQTNRLITRCFRFTTLGCIVTIMTCYGLRIMSPSSQFTYEMPSCNDCRDCKNRKCPYNGQKGLVVIDDLYQVKTQQESVYLHMGVSLPDTVSSCFDVGFLSL